MRHIVVAMDLSPACDRAFDRALRLARRDEADLTVTHIIDEQMLRYQDEDSDFARQLLARAERTLRKHLPSSPASAPRQPRLVVKIGSPWEDILGIAATANADLIVLGLHRVNPLKDMFIGTTAERIIRHSTRPVLVARDKPIADYVKAIVATDFSPSSGRALRAAVQVAAAAEIRLLHVFEPPFPAFIRLSKQEIARHWRELSDKAEAEVRTELADFARARSGGESPRVLSLVERGGVVPGISSVLEREQADLLVLGTRGRGALMGELLGSIAATFLNDCPCDVLICP